MVVTTQRNGKRMVQVHFKEGLSEREREILGLIAGGAADKEIAHQLHLSL
ncbi:MAG: LuxR C-terminal-related transcriptional regulator, partial [Anaerolineales bacterium]